MSVTVYGKPGCQQCTSSKRKLDKDGVPYEYVDVTEDADAYEYVVSLGYQQMPVTVAGDDHWSGFKPDKLEALKAAA